MLPPFFSDHATTTIGGSFFQAGGLGIHELAQRREHLREARFQEAQKLSWKGGI
jgi:hypothetical protein